MANASATNAKLTGRKPPSLESNTIFKWPLCTWKADAVQQNALYIFGIQMLDVVSELIFWHYGDLINHESRKSIEAIALRLFGMSRQIALYAFLESSSLARPRSGHGPTALDPA
jgi:hypothetical protein